MIVAERLSVICLTVETPRLDFGEHGVTLRAPIRIMRFYIH